ncbi:unnamed protein product [Schistocephalus solidus]|uniref:C2H2-type domain-containing protein n=1 Tax=Schistocephalus solidus TaxID=70667 RepID=A0A3P7BLP4_SCHSO|nr:unnamed protein product [Schistocephalus solidus]
MLQVWPIEAKNDFDAPLPTITDTILPPLPPAPITSANTTCPTPTTSVSTSDYLTLAIFNTTAAPITSDGDSVLTCPHCDRTFTSHIGLVGHLRIHRTETGELVPGAPTHIGDRRLQCPHCPRAFIHRMGLIGPMRIHKSGMHRDVSTSCVPINTSHTAPMSSATSTSSRSSRLSTSRPIVSLLSPHRPDRSLVNPSPRHRRTCVRTTVRGPAPSLISGLLD